MSLLVLLYVGHGGTCAKKWSNALNYLGRLPSQSPWSRWVHAFIFNGCDAFFVENSFSVCVLHTLAGFCVWMYLYVQMKGNFLKLLNHLAFTLGQGNVCHDCGFTLSWSCSVYSYLLNCSLTMWWRTLLYSLTVLICTPFLLQPGPRDGTIQCFIKRNKSNLTYHLYLCLSPGKFMFLMLPNLYVM